MSAPILEAALQYCEPEVRLAGGTYVDVEPTGAYADGNLVSAKGWPGLAAFVRECLKALGTRIDHGETASGSVRKSQGGVRERPIVPSQAAR